MNDWLNDSLNAGHAQPGSEPRGRYSQCLPLSLAGRGVWAVRRGARARSSLRPRPRRHRLRHADRRSLATRPPPHRTQRGWVHHAEPRSPVFSCQTPTTVPWPDSIQPHSRILRSPPLCSWKGGREHHTGTRFHPTTPQSDGIAVHRSLRACAGADGQASPGPSARSGDAFANQSESDCVPAAVSPALVRVSCIWPNPAPPAPRKRNTGSSSA